MKQLQQQKIKKEDKKKYKVITGNTVVDFIGQIRDSAIIEKYESFHF